MNTYAVILAGGVGSRFWPMSRELEPKQFLQFNGDKSLLQETVARVLPLVKSQRVLVVSNQQYKFQIQEQLREFGVPEANIILEPQAKNTAPAVGFAAWRIASRDPEAVMFVLPADHHIAKPSKLRNILKEAVRVAQEDNLVTIGIVPTRPHTGYGYIKMMSRGRTPARPRGKCFKVEKFVEKPDVKTAERYLKHGGYLWNSGMFVWKAAVIQAEIKSHLPKLYNKLSLMFSKPIEETRFRPGAGTVKETEFLPGTTAINPKLWRAIDPISIDYGILEKSRRVMVIPARDLGWSDLGSWNALSEIQEKDKSGNVFKGDCLDLDSCRTTVLSHNHLVATIGLKDVVVVDTEDALLVCDKQRTEDVKEIVARIRAHKRPEHFTHKTVKRPWGSYTVINHGNGFKVKLVHIAPNKRLSLQRHLKRSEHWVVVEGEAKITIGRDVFYRRPNQSIYVPPRGVHRLENATPKPLKIVEVQCGAYLEEDDIERLEDDHGRISQGAF